MKFVTSVKSCIKSDVKKLFPCEAMSTGIYDEIVKSLDEGKLPQFNDVKCCCKNGDNERECVVTVSDIERVLKFSGVMDMCCRYLLSGCNDEGEWY